MDLAKLRAWWAHRQGLDGALASASPAEVLERSGWSRSVGGVGPYLTLFARAGTSRAEADAAVSALQIHELPAARGCTYVLPASDFALGLAVGADFANSDMKQAAKLGVTEREIDILCAAVVKALAKGALDPEGIRAATGNASRSLGEAGKKKGLMTTLPLALGRLQSEGEIRRVPVNGRLDQQRYSYTLWRPNPLAKYKATTAESFAALATRFFRSVGPATLGEFQFFSGLGVKASKEAVAALGLVPIEDGSDRMLLSDDVTPFQRFKVPAKPQYAVISSLDPITANRRDLKSFVDAKDQAQSAVSDGARITLGSLADLPSHAIMDRGRLIGLWEYDAETNAIAWMTFGPRDRALESLVRKTEEYVRDQLGDARSFSLDSPKSRAPRVAALREGGQ